MTFDLEKERAADEALPYPLDANEIWVSGKGQMHINPPNAPSIFFTLSDLCEFRNLFHGQAAEIERLRAENAWLKSDREFQSEEQAAHIQELEDALVENLAADIAYDDRLLWSRLDGQRQDEYREKARQQLQAEGKIGPDAKPRVWQITEERKAALKRLYGLLVIRYKYSYPDETETLRSMLKEVEG